MSLTSFPIVENYVGLKNPVFWDIFIVVTMTDVVLWHVSDASMQG
jgi:hypothetical protein